MIILHNVALSGFKSFINYVAFIIDRIAWIIMEHVFINPLVHSCRWFPVSQERLWQILSTINDISLVLSTNSKSFFNVKRATKIYKKLWSFIELGNMTILVNIFQTKNNNTFQYHLQWILLDWNMFPVDHLYWQDLLGKRSLPTLGTSLSGDLRQPNCGIMTKSV